MSNSWYPKYPGDYGRDTSHLSLVEHGAYNVLLDHYYSTAKPIPVEREAIYRICRAFTEVEQQAVMSVVAQFFELQQDGYHNTRANKELAKQAGLRDALSNSGRRGAQKRWAKSEATAHPNGQAIGEANGPSMAYPQPPPHPHTELKPKPLVGTADGPSDGFDRFSASYPRKRNMARARAAWKKNVKPEEREFVLARLQMFIVGEWRDKDPQFIPYPASWLHGRRWEDEVEPEAMNGNNRRNNKPHGAIAPAAGKYEQRRPHLISTVSG